MSSNPFEIQKGDNTKVRGAVWSPRNKAPGMLPTVILVHGLKTHRDWGYLPRLREGLLGAGMAVVSFSFSRCGMDPKTNLIDEDLFASNTMGIELEETIAVIRGIQQRTLRGVDVIDLQRVGIFGTSRGGAAAICAAAACPDMIKAVFTHSSVATTQAQRLSADELALWRSSGRYREEVAETSQQIFLGPETLRDMEENPQRIENAARSLTVPFFIMHGGADPMRPEDSAHLLHQWAPHSELEILMGSNHTCNITRPYTGTTNHVESLNAAMVKFFSENV